MIVLQSRILAKTADEAAAKIYERHKNMKGPPSLSLAMRLNGGNWYEYTIEIDEEGGTNGASNARNRIRDRSGRF